MSFIFKWIITAIAAAVTVWLMPGLQTIGNDSTISIAIFALFFAIINVSIKPIAQLLAFPVTILTLGVFYLIVNGLMLMLASWTSVNLFASGIIVDGIGTAIIASIIISIVSCILNGIFGTEN